MINCMAAFQALSCRRLGYSGDILENGLGKIKAAERNDGVKSKTPSSSGGNLGTNLRTRIGDQDSNLQSNQGRNKNRGEKPDEGDDDGFDGEYSDTNKSGRGIEGAGKYLLSGGLAGAVSRTVTAPFDRLKVYLITNQYPKETSTTSAPSTSSPSTSRPLTLSANHRSKLWFTLKLIYNEHSNCNHNLSNPKLPHRTGFRNFFVGNGLNVIKVFPESALKFFVYEYCKSFFSNQIKNNKRSSSEIITTNTNSNDKYYDDDWQANQANDEFGAVEAVEDIGNFNRFIAGGVGGVVSQVVIYPIETLKTRLMSSTSNEKYQGRKLLLDSIKKL
ncbi:mitochondrial carrier domain-containing protein, partial [Phakopsora pachyrhizi]